MNWLLWVGGGLLVIIVIVTLLTVRIELDYRRKEENDSLSIHIATMGGLIRFKRHFPVLILHANDPSVQVNETRSGTLGANKKQKHRLTLDWVQHMRKNWQRLRSAVADLYGIIQVFLSKVRCRRLVWHSVIGTGDAAEAGMLTGLIWGLKSVSLRLGTNFIKMETVPSIQVTPDFTHPRLETHFTCIVKFRLGQAILTAIRIFFHIKKIKFNKGKGQSQQAANEAH